MLKTDEKILAEPMGLTPADSRTTRIRVLLSAIIVCLFFEAAPYSFELFGARIRAVQIIASVGFLAAAWWILKKDIRPKMSPADPWLALYLGLNVAAVFMSSQPARSIKIAVLLVFLVLLYHLVALLAGERNVFPGAFRLFLAVGLAQVFFGLYQVVAGMIRHVFGWNWPIGHLDLFHARFIGAPWGRPYGTLVESNWYGAVCLFYAVVFLALAFSGDGKKIFVRIGAAASLAGLFFSFVRGAWAGFLAACLFLYIFRRKAPRLRIRPAAVARIAAVALIVLVAVYIVSPPFQAIIQKRFFPSGEADRYQALTIRFHAINESWHHFLESPILGHGPGTPGEILDFNHSLIMTALVDTGVLGLLALLIWLAVFFSDGLKKTAGLDPDRQPAALGLLAGLTGLLFSYIFTTGLWIPFTWVFLGFFTAAVRAQTGNPRMP